MLLVRIVITVSNDSPMVRRSKSDHSLPEILRLKPLHPPFFRQLLVSLAFLLTAIQPLFADGPVSLRGDRRHHWRPVPSDRRSSKSHRNFLHLPKDWRAIPSTRSHVSAFQRPGSSPFCQNVSNFTLSLGFQDHIGPNFVPIANWDLHLHNETAVVSLASFCDSQRLPN